MVDNVCDTSRSNTEFLLRVLQEVFRRLPMNFFLFLWIFVLNVIILSAQIGFKLTMSVFFPITRLLLCWWSKNMFVFWIAWWVPRSQKIWPNVQISYDNTSKFVSLFSHDYKTLFINCIKDSFELVVGHNSTIRDINFCQKMKEGKQVQVIKVSNIFNKILYARY